MRDDSSFLDVYKSKKVLVTGHTGFKGSWLAKWLIMRGAKVSGLALDPHTNPSMFEVLNLEDQLDDHRVDIRNRDMVLNTLRGINPDIIFHLASQTLVKHSYKDPIETLETNVLGIAFLMDAIRSLNLNTSLVVITSDKCYENKEWEFGYRENDALGGYDPYSSSKGMKEILVSSWRRSFFDTESSGNSSTVATVRAGNVIGGGDWAENRIVPDCVRAFERKDDLILRNPSARRPWQHVLEPLGGYLLLGARMLEQGNSINPNLLNGLNFGPLISSNRKVSELVEKISEKFVGQSWKLDGKANEHEAGLLHLSTDKAFHLLGWLPVWSFEETVQKTIDWYLNFNSRPENIVAFTEDQIKGYEEEFRRKMVLTS